MSLFDSRLFAWLRPKPPEPRQQRTTSSPRSRRDTESVPLHGRALAGKRLSADKASDTLGGSFAAIMYPQSSEASWRTQSLDSTTLSRLKPAKLLELMVDLSPEISSGLWNFLRLCNPGWEVKAIRPGSENNEIDQRAQDALDEFINNIPGIYEQGVVPLDLPINTLFLSAFLRGAVFAELVLDEDGREPVNLATPDPDSARFKKINDEIRGKIWQLGQYQNGQWVPMDRETVQYLPIDPLPGLAYGRPLVAPALFACLFLINLLHDLRRVVAQQGYPRLDISIDFEALAQMAPEDAQPGTAAFNTWVDEIMSGIQTFYANLEPEDAYVHASSIEVNRPVGAVGSDALGAIDALVQALERMAARALKMMPLLLGIETSTTETNAIRQWEIQTAAIKSIQHLVETLLERLFGLALECQGIQADIQFRFAELRASEMMRDAQTEAMQIMNAQRKYQAGWISQDEAAEEIVGHPADLPEPRVLDLGGRADIVTEDLIEAAEAADAQNENAQILTEVRQARDRVTEAIAIFSANGVHE